MKLSRVKKNRIPMNEMRPATVLSIIELADHWVPGSDIIVHATHKSSMMDSLGGIAAPLSVDPTTNLTSAVLTTNSKSIALNTAIALCL
jgi:hypothetical protein